MGNSPARDLVYLDHAATTPTRPVVVEAMLPFLTDVYGNPSGGHGVARAAKTALEAAREQLAADLGAGADEVVFTSGGTEADGLALKGAAHAARDADPGRDGRQLGRREQVEALEQRGDPPEEATAQPEAGHVAGQALIFRSR